MDMIRRFHDLEVSTPRSYVVIAYINDYLLSTSTSRASYADDVKTLYNNRTPEKARIVRFHSGGDTFADMKANDQILSRYLDRTVKFPADLEEACVLAMPEEWRIRCMCDLHYRYGRLSAPIVASQVVGREAAAAQDLSRMVAKFASTLNRLAPIVADNLVDENDIPFASAALSEILDMMGDLEGWRAALTHLLEKSDGRS